MDFEDYSQSDHELIKQQLGCKKLFVKGIIERCSFKHPRIVLLNPVNEENENGELNYQAISNLMWLTCPYLNDKIHEFETQGLITSITDLIQHDSMLSSMMRSAHANFYFLRNLIFSKYAHSAIVSRPEDIFKNGIGGTSNLDTLKCLHTHFCHFRIFKNNIAGLVTYKLLNGKMDCDNDMCSKFL